MTIFYELFWRQSLVVLCGSPLSYSELFCVLLFVVSSSEDSLLLSCVAIRCLTVSFSVFFYLLWALLKTVSCCPVWQSVVLLWALLCSFICCELFWRQSLVILCGSPLSYSELFCVLLFVVSSSEDSLLLSCVAVRCLTLSSSVLFYYASFAAWVSFFWRWLFFRHFCFVDPTSLRGFYFMQFQTQGFVILYLEFERGC